LSNAKREQFIARYNAAAHAVQSGIAVLLHRDPTLAEPKHVRVGIDTAKAEQGGLARLLIHKGIFTEVEYFEAMAEAMEQEKARLEQELSTGGTTIHLQ